MKKYFLYTRKSSEDKDRQVQSIPDQISVMVKKSESLWIKIIHTFEEEMSAKSPWRPAFNEMVQRIRNWEAEGIVSWKLDRLSRNPIDSWTLQYMLQTWELELIVTNDRNYTDTDAWLLFSVESWIWNQFILDLKKAVKRWMDYKTDSGVFCGMAPEWYLNKKDDKTIIVDEERFELIRKMWELMLTWNYTVRQVMEIANEQWSFKRRWTKKRPPSKLKLSGMYKMFNSVFYTWDFMWNGQIKKWTHKSMISYQEFYRVQEMLGEKWIHIQGRTREFAYTGFMKCWECGSSITATQKTKTSKTTWEVKYYIYYYCTKRKQWCEKCSQWYIKVEDLESQIDNLLLSIEIMPEFKEWWLEILKESFASEIKLKEEIQRKMQLSLDESEKKLRNLTEALIWELIDKEEFVMTKKLIKIDIEKYREKLSKLWAEKDYSFDETEKLFDFITQARTHFNHWDLQTKKEIFRSLGLNWTLKDWKLHWIVYPWFEPIQKFTSENDMKNTPLELIKNSTSAGSKGAKNSVFQNWYSTVLAIRKAILEHWEKIYLPK